MATRKSTTKAKTKTSTAKSRSTKAVSRASVPARSSTTVKSSVNLLKIRRLLIIASSLYALLAIVAGVIMKGASYELTVGYLTKDELASKASTVLAPAIHVLYDVEIRWIVVALLVLSLVAPILYLTSLEKRYGAALKGRVLSWRWIDLAVTGAIVTETVALLNGIQDIMVLKLLAGLVVIGCILAWISEKQNENASAPVWNTYITSLISWSLPWLLIIVYMIGTMFYGMARSPWYVYAASLAALGGFGLLAWNQYNQHRRFKNWKDYLVVERNFLVINMLAKVVFVAILVIGLHK